MPAGDIKLYYKRYKTLSNREKETNNGLIGSPYIWETNHRHRASLHLFNTHIPCQHSDTQPMFYSFNLKVNTRSVSVPLGLPLMIVMSL